MKAVHLLFYRPLPEDKWLNHVVTFFDPPFSHCDLQFDNNIATSIYQNECVYIEQKSFSRLNYERLSISLRDDEHERLVKYCTEAYKNKVSFDMTGMILSYVPFISRNPENRTFCSRYVYSALKHSGNALFQSHDPSKMTPSKLYNIVKAVDKTFLHISEKRMSMLL